MVRAAILFIAIVLVGCGNGLKPPPPIELAGLTGSQEELNLRFLISVCSAGLGEGTKGKIFAEIDRRGGNFGVEFQEYIRGAIFSDDSTESSDKVKLFEYYLKCVAGTESTIGTKCQRLADSCRREQGARLKACLENARNSCIRECVFDHGFERDKCVSELCNPGTINVAHWMSRRCEYEQDEFLECEAKFRSCMSRE